jgi:hypothetical protein
VACATGAILGAIDRSGGKRDEKVDDVTKACVDSAHRERVAGVIERDELDSECIVSSVFNRGVAPAVAADGRGGRAQRCRADAAGANADRE